MVLTNLNSSQCEERLKSQNSIPTLFENMQIMEKSDHSKQQQDNENFSQMIFSNSFQKQNQKIESSQEKTSSTQESLQFINEMILTDRSNSSEVKDQNMQITKSSVTLHQELISKEKDSWLFWTDAYKELSEKLLLPTKIDSADLLSNLLNQSSKNAEENSSSLTVVKTNQQNKNLQKISLISSTFSHAEQMVKESTKQGIRTLKFQVRPTNKQKKILNELFGASRFVYNKTVNAINEEKREANFMNLRTLLVTTKSKTDMSIYKENQELKKRMKKLEGEEKEKIKKRIEELTIELKNADAIKNKRVSEWESEIPKDLRAGAVSDACDAYKVGMSNLTSKNIKKFILHYKEKRNRNQTFVIPKNAITISKTIDADKKIVRRWSFRFFKTFFKKHKVDDSFQTKRKTFENLTNLDVEHDCRMSKQGNRYWILVPVSWKGAENRQIQNICGVDAGVRTFMTTYGSQTTQYEHNRKAIDKCNKRIDDLKSEKQLNFRERHRNQSDLNTNSQKRIRNKKQLLERLERRKKGLIDNLHWTAIKHLTNDNDLIFFGDIESQGIVKGNKNHHLNRDMNDLKFYQFKERLKYKSALKGVSLHFVDERYTTKTCSSCGCLSDPKASKIFNCSHCEMTFERDINAAKNILLKGLITFQNVHVSGQRISTALPVNL